MSKICIGIQMEFKGLRLFKLQLFISMVLMPFSYIFVILLSENVHGEEISYLLSGFIIASLIGSFISMLALRVSNLMQAEVLELYSTLPINTIQIIFVLLLSYTILALPQVLLSIGFSIAYAKTVNITLLILGVIISTIALSLFGVFLGLLIKNFYKAQGFLPLLAWILLLISPTYYRIQHLNLIYKIVILANPVTQGLNIIRASLGFDQTISVRWSFFYLTIMVVLLYLYIVRSLRKMYILEKLY